MRPVSQELNTGFESEDAIGVIPRQSTLRPIDAKYRAFRYPPNAEGLGLCAFGMTTIILSFVNLGVAEDESLGLAASFAVFHGGLAQLIAGLFELHLHRFLSGTAFVTYGVFWLSWGLYELLLATNAIPAPSPPVPTAKCVWFCVWGVFTALLSFTTFYAPKTTRAIQSVLCTLAMVFFFLAGGVYSDVVQVIGGALGVLCGSLAVYTGFAELLLLITRGEEILPLFRVEKNSDSEPHRASRLEALQRSA
ncbi:hypothetical protein SARC_03565 [Sphaeroforma arctica JP610]|uniref:GPR1/FUN34/yaaH family protein n=1 Tax=Sphaeroforma arctica JP610 TaxID=667725 RepID=A0A0L0G5I7_9EUKA|nr:hypothetical protein SARC_03565 [Sphaeroforma arctica JP610]KNC84204.1 hypothetical protein SARC_03565 [Sphaeroforma arctica JP610]|eukprot:XP_014158106.1 hypothetical protein SARC_03565 [Sphaeroforma arctica JP610]